jgi:vacuolar-type H+-ATPase subunit F/Vma7
MRELSDRGARLSRAETTTRAIEDAFKDFTNRDDVAVLLINQYVRPHPPSWSAV